MGSQWWGTDGVGSDRQALAQTVHDLGSALWFGGAVMGIAGVNKSGADLSQGIDRIRVASSAWSRFAPVQWAGITAVFVAGAKLTAGSAGRYVVQQGYPSLGAAKVAVSVAGAAATAFAAYSGMKVGRVAEELHARGRDVEVKDASIPTAGTPAELAVWQRRQRASQYLVPVFAGANIALNSTLVQSYRAGTTARGALRRLLPG
ncbi:hypothetical protein CLV92_11025 [Kineococcus xinjiangensis]|uniref:Uncharacterized protein n=1 Tax=Kineococcus xinjiangensis TaxID=512762 RepID=A0A2S6IGS3_9ACTN|nr:hypothetical protein [Kineococcus xinjiangensis]PPK93397.1 hypothetical protein CLV92_11025 [Kineococcus xinjiangensis]